MLFLKQFVPENLKLTVLREYLKFDSANLESLHQSPVLENEKFMRLIKRFTRILFKVFKTGGEHKTR